MQCRPSHGLKHDEYSWESAANIHHRADIDHVLVLPASAAMSARTFGRALNSSNDHLPVVVTFDHAVYGSPVPSILDDPPPSFRLNIANLDDHRHTVKAALELWCPPPVPGAKFDVFCNEKLPRKVAVRPKRKGSLLEERADLEQKLSEVTKEIGLQEGEKTVNQSA